MIDRQQFTEMGKWAGFMHTIIKIQAFRLDFQSL